MMTILKAKSNMKRLKCNVLAMTPNSKNHPEGDYLKTEKPCNRLQFIQSLLPQNIKQINKWLQIKRPKKAKIMIVMRRSIWPEINLNKTMIVTTR